MKYIVYPNASMIAENVENIRRRVALACKTAGRKPEDVSLIAVTKTWNSEMVQAVVQAGIVEVGENYVQEMLEKYEALGSTDIRWHFIGHLQTNKVKYIAPWVYLIHAVDSAALGKEISKRALQAGRTIPVLIEVNTSGEESKYGVTPEAVIPLAQELSKVTNIALEGLMTIGPFLPDPEESRPAFRKLKELQKKLQDHGFTAPHLSMGMTNDFEVAIQEGATIVRVGTAIFGKRIKR